MYKSSARAYVQRAQYSIGGVRDMDETIICRCSDVTLGRVRELISQGYTSMDEIKRITRLGMGPCQGKTCSLLVMRELSLIHI